MPIQDKAAATAEVAKSFRFDGQVAVVTGAARGIGAEIAERLLCLGAKVVLADRAPEVEATATALRERGFDTDFAVFDVTDSAAVDKAVETIERKHGGVGVLIANAGIAYEKKAVEHTDEEWRRVMNINLDGVFFTVRGFARPMLERGKGAIVAISSIAGVKAVRPELHVGYDVSKAGVAHLCRVLGVEWAKQGVRINAIGPGYTDTEMLGAVGRSNPAMMAVWLGDTPTGRLMRPAEIAAGVTFLACDAANGITGQLLMVDGGYSVA
jgi:NAD(P)-dependent dehydrogenase (short-subunit alcohol dehydrogenase family)